MEGKKISFGFSKINIKPNLLAKKENETVTKVELIKCLEGQEIKLIEEKPEELPLIIPIKESCRTSTALASLMKRRAVLLDEEESEVNIDHSVNSSIPTNNEDSEDIEQRAARELLADIDRNNSADPTNSLVLPAVKPEDLPLEGAKESTLDDYESVPIQDFGKAMLRGMGWVEPAVETNKKGGPPVDDTPMVRPMGMGLGADKALKKQTLLVAPEANEVLEIKRNAYVIILGGKHKGLYGKIEGFDDHAGRVIVKMAIGGAIEAFNEFLCQPVSRKEYDQYGKCINTSKYEEYKTKTSECNQIMLEKDEKSLIDKSKKIKNERPNFIEDEYPKDNGDMGRNLKKVDCIENKKDIKRETGLYREEQKGSSRDKKLEYDKYDDKKYNKYKDRKSIKEACRNDSKDRGNEDYGDDGRDCERKYHHRDRKEYHRDDERHRQREQDKYESKSNETHSQMLKRNDHDEHKKSNAKHCEKPSNSKKDRQKERKQESYDESSDKLQHKKVELHDLSNSENYSSLSKHKKSKKSKLKKSKKSKKRYRSNSLDTETSPSSLDSSSDSEDEKYKKHKKKTKKSKRQRERSRSRGRR